MHNKTFKLGAPAGLLLGFILGMQAESVVQAAQDKCDKPCQCQSKCTETFQACSAKCDSRVEDERAKCVLDCNDALLKCIGNCGGSDCDCGGGY